MNFYNPFLLAGQAFPQDILATLFKTDSNANFSSSQPASLNQKRPLRDLTQSKANDSNLPGNQQAKKLKVSESKEVVSRSDATQPQSEIDKLKTKNTNGEETQNLLIQQLLGSLTGLPNPFFNQPNKSATSLWSAPTFKDLVMLEIYKHVQTQNLIQSLIQKRSDICNINQAKLSVSQDDQLTATRSTSLQSDYSKRDLVMIDEDDSTCQTTPQSNNENLVESETDLSFKPSIINNKLNTEFDSIMALKAKVRSDKPKVFTIISNRLPKKETQESLKSLQVEQETLAVESSNTVMEPKDKTIYAKIPSFQLFKVCEDKPQRKVKLAWEPNNAISKTGKNFFEEVQGIVKVQITNEVKVIETLKQYGMNQEEALEKIKRNRAHYKSYFRVQKIGYTRPALE